MAKDLTSVVYLDNAATHICIPAPSNGEEQFPMNSNTPYATREKKALEQARQDVKKCLGLKGGKVLFTSSATESVDWLVKQFRQRGGIVYCGKTEHDSVKDAIDSQYNYFSNDNNLRFTSLYLHQYVNQLDGRVFDLEHWFNTVKKTDFEFNHMFGTDITAAVGKVRLPANIEDFCDAMWFSAHKYGGVCGVGYLWLSDRLFEDFGGDTDPRNNYGLIHRTLNTEAIVKSTNKLKSACVFLESNVFEAHYQRLCDSLTESLQKNVIDFTLFSDKSAMGKTYAINLLYLRGINADALQQYLIGKDIFVGLAASACTSSHDYRVPIELGLTEDEARQSIRVSFSPDNTLTDIYRLVNGIADFKRIYLGE